MKPILLLALALVAGCATSADEPQKTEPKPFFDLNGYVERQLEMTPWAGKVVTKTVVIDGQEERQTLEAPDLRRDLDLFAKADINRPAWVDKYRLETEGRDTTYIATDPELRTQRLQVIRNEAGEVARIEISRRTGNLLTSGGQELTYRPASGYRIQSSQVGEWVGNAEVVVTASW